MSLGPVVVLSKENLAELEVMRRALENPSPALPDPDQVLAEALAHTIRFIVNHPNLAAGARDGFAPHLRKLETLFKPANGTKESQ